MGSSWDLVVATLPGWAIAAGWGVLLGGLGALALGLRASARRFVVGGGAAVLIAGVALTSNSALARHVDEQSVITQLGEWMTTERGEVLTPLPAEGITVDRGARTVEFTAVNAEGDPRRYVLVFPAPVDTTGTQVHVNDSPRLRQAGGLFGWP